MGLPTKDDPNDNPDIYEKYDSELAEKNVYEAKKLVENIAKIAKQFNADAYNYGLTKENVSKYKTELLNLAKRLAKTELAKTDNGYGKMKKLLSLFMEAVNDLQPAPVYKQTRIGKSTPSIQDRKDEVSSGTGTSYVEPTNIGPGIEEEEEEDYPLPPGLFDEGPEYEFSTPLTSRQRQLVELIKRRFNKK